MALLGGGSIITICKPQIVFLLHLSGNLKKQTVSKITFPTPTKFAFAHTLSLSVSTSTSLLLYAPLRFCSTSSESSVESKIFIKGNFILSLAL